jgi:hypothetical protein
MVIPKKCKNIIFLKIPLVIPEEAGIYFLPFASGFPLSWE